MTSIPSISSMPSIPSSIECVQLKNKKDYPFYHPDEEEGKSVCTAILDLCDEDRIKFCDKTQLNKEGKYRIPKVTTEMIKAKIKEREEAPEIVKQQQEIIKTIVEHAREKEKELNTIKSEFEAYKALTEERFNKLASLLIPPQQS